MVSWQNTFVCCLVVVAAAAPCLTLITEEDEEVEVEVEVERREIGRSHFPEGFIFGVAASAYQYEGAYLEDGKGLSDWDVFAHTPGRILDGSTADVAVDQYHRYLEDVNILHDLGVDSYRFSIAWSRIFPDGRGQINWKGVNYYNNLIDALVDKGINPFVTLSHYDIPQALQDLYGGFLSPQIIDDFGRYAEACFRLFGDRVKMWATFNEPNVYLLRGYDDGLYPPCRCSFNCSAGNSSTEPYIVAHNLLQAHAVAVRNYRTKFHEHQQGMIGIVVSTPWIEPYSANDPGDIAAAQKFLDFIHFWIMDPLVKGEYPLTMQRDLGERLPAIKQELREVLQGSLDFIGVNCYGSYLVSRSPIPETDSQPCPLQNDLRLFVTGQRNGTFIGPPMTPVDLYAVPSAVRRYLKLLKTRYPQMPVIISENGFGDFKNDSRELLDLLNDSERANYIADTLASLNKSIREDGSNAIGYYVWSLLDNFEWRFGYTSSFGIYYVNISSTNLHRYPRKSALWYRRFLQYSSGYDQS